ncbi:hypothetical protein DPMN_135887 [Dreissena polymorpha]|uniref:Uncharacterized protein n=1 Tax=Dreissena polymorpha TaxID=45954 RepID=A0A9D4G4R9_DREPO|nr:hypothetical protein DPMN_135887 [Dreissena polymorpha]
MWSVGAVISYKALLQSFNLIPGGRHNWRNRGTTDTGNLSYRMCTDVANTTIAINFRDTKPIKLVQRDFSHHQNLQGIGGILYMITVDNIIVVRKLVVALLKKL